MYIFYITRSHLFASSSVERHFICLWVFDDMNKASSAFAPYFARICVLFGHLYWQHWCWAMCWLHICFLKAWPNSSFITCISVSIMCFLNSCTICYHHTIIFLMFSILIGLYWSHYVLICLSLLGSDIKHIFYQSFFILFLPQLGVMRREAGCRKINWNVFN